MAASMLFLLMLINIIISELTTDSRSSVPLATIIGIFSYKYNRYLDFTLFFFKYYVFYIGTAYVESSQDSLYITEAEKWGTLSKIIRFFDRYYRQCTAIFFIRDGNMSPDNTLSQYRSVMFIVVRNTLPDLQKGSYWEWDLIATALNGTGKAVPLLEQIIRRCLYGLS